MQVLLSGFKKRHAHERLIHVNATMLFAIGVETDHPPIAHRRGCLIRQVFLFNLKLSQETVKTEDEVRRFAQNAFDVKTCVKGAQDLGASAQRKKQTIIDRGKE